MPANCSNEPTPSSSPRPPPTQPSNTNTPVGGEPDGSEGVDVSHRGGRPGFVRVDEAPTATYLTVPDFSGNFIFNTFGNLEVNPRAGIVCADFANADVLSLTGSARVIWHGPEVEAFEGAQRLFRFEVESAVFLSQALPLRFHGLEPSPDLAETGTWAGANNQRHAYP